MKSLTIPKGLSRSFHKFGLRIKKHSPEILVGVGVVGTIASAVMACKATTKVSDILEEAKEQIDAIHQVVEKKDNEGKYTQEDTNKALTIVYVKTGLELVKLYAPAVTLGALSLAGIVTSHHIMRKRNIALAAAYLTEHTGFKEYRDRVITRFGQELDRELKNNIKIETVNEHVIDEDGNEQVVERKVEVTNPNDYSTYARFFDDGCKGWSKNSELNLCTLRSVQNYANDLLKSRGYVFLNDVYDMLGIHRSRAGQVVGWIYNEDRPNGDNFIDFGIYDVNKPTHRDFVNGYENVILLDFNVDGNILDLIEAGDYLV